MTRPLTRVCRRHRQRQLAVESLERRHAMAVFTVTNINDSGVGSLREAIDNANAHIGQDQIQFNVASTSKVIALQTPLPFLLDSTEIDGTTQPGFSGNPLIELDGSSITTENTSGLVIASANSSIRGLVINNFYNGIALNQASRAKVVGNYLGVGVGGTQAVGNHWVGVYVVDSMDSQIGGSTVADRNIISGNGEIGVRLVGNSFNTRIQGNYIGTDVTGTKALPNNQWGILVSNGAGRSIIGTDGDGSGDATEGNIVSANLWSGIRLSGTDDNVVAGNLIGLGAGDRSALGNGFDGVQIDFLSSGNLIGTNADGISDSLEANFIGYNRDNGIRISNAFQSQISGNSIGLARDGVTAIPNINSGVLMDSGSTDNVIGLASADQLVSMNVIAGNGGYGVNIYQSNGNSIQGNLIGRTADDQSPLVNLLAGVQITASNNNVIGSSPQLANRIGYRFTGIVVTGSSAGNAFPYNDYYGQTTMPIDLNGDSSTDNDLADIDAGPNDLQNFPVVKSATLDGVVSGTFNSLPFRAYKLPLYTNQLSADGLIHEYRYLTTVDVSTDEQGNAAWIVDTEKTFTFDKAISALAHDGHAGTSEFSPVANVGQSRAIVLSQTNFAESVGSILATVFRSSADPGGSIRIQLTTSDSTRATVPAQVVIPDNADSAQFTVQIIDDQRYRYDQLILFAATNNTSTSVELLVNENDNPWYHTGKALDVSGDGVLSALDALLIINELNGGRSGSLNTRRLEFPPTFCDVSNDRNLTALDALLVINGINSRASVAGEGERDAEVYGFTYLIAPMDMDESFDRFTYNECSFSAPLMVQTYQTRRERRINVGSKIW